MYYATDIFKSAGVGDSDSIYVTIAVGCWNFVTTFIAVGIVDRVGRRPLFLGGMVLMVLGNLLLGIAVLLIPNPAGSYISIVCIFVFITGFESGIGPLFWILINEVFPRNVREQAGSVVNVLQWGFNLFLTLLFPKTVDAIGLGPTYLIFGGIGVFSIIYGFFFLWETKTAESEDTASIN